MLSTLITMTAEGGGHEFPTWLPFAVGGGALGLLLLLLFALVTLGGGRDHT